MTITSKIADPEVRKVVIELIDIVDGFADKSDKSFKNILNSLLIINQKVTYLESIANEIKRDTKIIPDILQMLEGDGIDIANIRQRIKKLEN